MNKLFDQSLRSKLKESQLKLVSELKIALCNIQILLVFLQRQTPKRLMLIRCANEPEHLELESLCSSHESPLARCGCAILMPTN